MGAKKIPTAPQKPTSNTPALSPLHNPREHFPTHLKSFPPLEVAVMLPSAASKEGSCLSLCTEPIIRCKSSILRPWKASCMFAS